MISSLARLSASSFCALLAVASAHSSPQLVGHVWERHTDAPVSRFEGPMLPIDGRLWILGGFYNNPTEVTTRVDAFDPATNSWAQVTTLPTGVTHVAMVRDGRKLWMLGGFVGNNPGVATAAVWIYDIDLNTWTPGPPLPRPIAAGAAARVGNLLHYYGGCEADRNTMTGDHWVLDLAMPQAGWFAAPPMPEPRCHLSGVELNGLVYAIGGQYRHDTNPEDVRFLHVFDPVQNSWTAGPELPAPRSHAEPGTYVQDGKIFVCGGKSSPQQLFVLSDVLIFDPATQQWSFGVPLPAPRYGVGVQPLGDRIYFSTGAFSLNRPRVETFSRHKNDVMPNPIRINVGGDEYTSPFDGRIWTGDFLTEDGDPVTYPGALVNGTNDPDLFRVQRRGGGSIQQNRLWYRLPTGPGFYRCRCYFAELEHTSPSQRRFDIRLEGSILEANLDPVAAHGSNQAFSRAFDVFVADDDLDLQILSSLDRPTLAALELETLPNGHFVRECTSVANSTGMPARIGFVGSTSLADHRLTLIANSVPANTFCLFFQAQLPLQQTIPGGILCLTPPLYRRTPVQANGNFVAYTFDPAGPNVPQAVITAGSTWRFQGWFRDLGTNPLWGFTDALKFVFTP